MLKMSQYELIKTAYRVYGKSIREIAREYGHSRKTVRKAIREVSPVYEQKQERVHPVMDPYRDVIVSWLRLDKKMPRKQRHTARRIFTRLQEEYDFTGCESTVRRFVRKLKISNGLYRCEAFIPLEADPGKEAEVDWGEAIAIIGGERRKVNLFCMRPKYSGKDFVRAYPHARQEAFFDGHIHAFRYYGGVFPRLIYDNLSSAVLRVLRGKRRIEQEAFITFRSYYTYEAHFCNPGKGNEKGGVEGLVGYARRNYLVPVPEAESFEALNEILLSRCLSHTGHRTSGKSDTIAALFEVEQPLLLPLPASDYPVKQILPVNVDHYSTVTVDSNRYSVPTEYAGLQVSAELGVDHLKVYYNRKLVADHVRVFGKSKWQLDPFHYLELLTRKPQAFDSARPIRQWRESWPGSYERLLGHFRDRNGQSKGTKEFIKVLMLLPHYSRGLVDAAIEKALTFGLSDAAAIKLLLDYQLAESMVVNPLSIDAHPKLAGYQVAAPDLESYGSLLEGGRHEQL